LLTQTTALNTVAVDTWSRLSCQLAVAGTLATVKVDIFDVKCMNVTREV
jgi:hypothetical protein